MLFRAAIRASWCSATAPCGAAILFFVAYGTYASADGKWKDELTNEEHSPSLKRSEG